MEIRSARGVFQLLKRPNIIEYPERASICCQDQIVLPRLDLNVVDRDVRETVPQVFPICATIKRDIRSKFGPCKKEIAIIGIFAKAVSDSGHFNAILQSRPGVPEVRGAEYVGLIIVLVRPVERYICRAFIKV